MRCLGRGKKAAAIDLREGGRIDGVEGEGKSVEQRGEGDGRCGGSGSPPF